MKFRQVHCLSFAVAFLTACGSGPGSGPSSDSDTSRAETPYLAFRWPADRPLNFRIQLSQEVELEVPGKTINNYVRLDQHYRIVPRSPEPDGSQKLDLSFGDQVSSMRENELVDEFDSKSEAASQRSLLANSFGRIVGQSLVIHLDSNLAVQKIQGINSLLLAMTESVQHQPQLVQMVRSIFDAHRIEKMLYVIPLPTSPVVLGDAWPIEEAGGIANLGQLDSDGMATLSDVETAPDSQRFRIDFEGTLRGRDQPPVPYQLKGGRFKGHAWFDDAYGQFTDSIFTYRLDVENDSLPGTPSNRPSIRVTQKYATKLIVAGGASP